MVNINFQPSTIFLIKRGCRGGKPKNFEIKQNSESRIYIKESAFK